MKTNIPALAILAAVLPSCALAQQTAAELPTLSSVIAELARPEGRSHDAIETAKTAAHACMPWMSTAQVGRGVFENDYTIKINGSEVAKVEKTGDGWLIKDYAGNVEAKATVSGGNASVTGCNGEALGSIEQVDDSGGSAFNIKGADGAPLMTTGWVDGGDMAASAPKASLKVEKNGMFDHFTVTINGAAPQVGVFVTVMNNAAAYKRAQERRRENMGGHGRI